MTISLNLTHNLNQLLSNLKLPICLKDYLEVAERCEKEKLSHIEFFYEILQRESDYRMQKKIDKLVKSAQLPRDKLLSDFDMTRIPGLAPSQIIQLAEGEFIDRYGNVLIFGNPGTGKTHLSIVIKHKTSPHYISTFFKYYIILPIILTKYIWELVIIILRF